MCCWLRETQGTDLTSQHMLQEPSGNPIRSRKATKGLRWDVTADRSGDGIDPGLTGMRELDLGQKCPREDK